ncbi:phosphatidate cytidylyltransferase [Fodinibius roseus]|uniref:Phosphatidate cytidylyltransferase n=1 Tax=Fodinibius roseus TaxID=1194090 RepID=A0A1M4XX45_9BACT|nr:phosphatidate cytidylyltransferase [Fodinibius roseus]SHE97873.1 phosphatidate cytidylyltransferase [Fodinibius roseus]
MSELTKRILFAVPAAAFFLYLTYVGGVFFATLIVLIGLLIQREVSVISGKAGFPADPMFPYIIGLWVLLSPFLSHNLVVGLTVFLLFIGTQIIKPGDRGLKSLVSTAFCGLYASLGLLALLLIRQLGNTETGFILTLSLLLMVWGNDIFAYFGGKNFGKNHLAPKISPNKTWEGFFFGIAGALAGLAIAFYLVPFAYPSPLPLMLPAVLLISVFGPVGDLTASRLKRAAGVKDASRLIPGHGGFFDRFDALILAAPAFYVYLKSLEIMGYVSF